MCAIAWSRYIDCAQELHLQHPSLGAFARWVLAQSIGNLRPPRDALRVYENGNIVEAYYGSDAGDHIPFERVELFVARGMLKRAA